MSSKKKNPINEISPLTVSVLTIYSVLSGEDLSDIANIVSEASPVYLLMGVGCVTFSIWVKFAILHYLLGTLGIKTKGRIRFLYSSIGSSFSCATPSTGEGQSAQVYYMRRNMIPVPVATVMPMVVAVTYRFVLVVIDCLLAVPDRDFLDRYPHKVMSVYYLGLRLNVIFCAAVLVLASHVSLVRDMAMRVLEFLKHLRFPKKRTSRTGYLLLTMEHYDDTAAFLRQHKHVLFRVLFLIFCQRLVLFSVTHFVYRAFGLKGTAMVTLALLQSTTSMSVDMLPLPEGIGISEYLFLIVFDPIFYGDPLSPTMVLSRSIAYYVQLGLSAAVTMYAHITLMRKHRRIQKDFRLSKNDCAL